jgi:hypothetical protein
MSSVLLVSGLSGAVLCIGEDGHFEIGTARAVRCKLPSAASACEADVEVSVAAGEACGDCLDITLSADGMPHATPAKSQAGSARLSRAVWTSAAAAGILQTSCCSWRLPVPPAVPACLASGAVVLRL